MTDTTIATVGIINALEPYVISAIGAVIIALGSVITLQIKKYTGITIDNATTLKVDNYIKDKAAQAVASAGDNLAHETIDVHSPIVAELTTKVINSLPTELSSVGITPEAVSHKLAAEFGRLQATMTTVTIPPKKEPEQ